MIRNEDQKALWELLKKVVSFLEENNIKYYLFAGTAIGALRHEGFVPWDNDVDLLMDRENYYKMISLADKLPWDDIDLVSAETSDLYFRPYAQFSYKRDTSFLKSGMFNHGECMGTLIDIMCLDDIPSSRLEEYQRDLLLYQETLIDAFTYNYRIDKYAEECLALKEECRQKGKRQVITRLREKLESYANDECDECVVRFWGRKIRNYKKSWFDETRYVEFEGVKMPVAGKAEACLRHQYGYNWYMIPAVIDQEVHGFYSHHGISYNNYADDIDSFLDWDQVNESLRLRKYYSLKRMPHKHKMERYQRMMSAQRLVMKLVKANIEADINNAFNNQEHERVIELADPLRRNLDSLAEIDLEASGLSMDVIHKLIYSLVVTGRYYLADKVILELIPNWSNQIANVHEIEVFDMVMKMQECYQDGDDEGLAKLVGRVRDDERKLIPEYIVSVNKLRTKGIINIDVEEMNKLCDEYCKVFDSNWDVWKVKGDCLLEMGNETEAVTIYQKVYENTRNGLIELELKKKYSFYDKFAE